MGLDIFFGQDVEDHVAALALANARAMAWAKEWGASARDVAIAKAAYEAALLDVGVSFGLHRRAMVIIFQGKVVVRERSDVDRA